MVGIPATSRYWQPRVVIKIGRPLKPCLRNIATPLFVWPELGPNGRPFFVIDYLAKYGWYRWTYCDGIEFFIHESGREVWVNWPSGESAQSAAFYLVGPILGFVLRLRGAIALHGSTIALNGRAVVILGDSGAGKSTLAAALMKRGCAVLTDDLAPLQLRDDHFDVIPGYSRLRLWPDSAEAICRGLRHLDRLVDRSTFWPDWDKRALDLSVTSGEFEVAPKPLSTIFILGPRTDVAPRVESLSGSQSVIELVRHIYQGYLSDAARRVNELDVLTQLAGQISVKRLHLSNDIHQLDSACDLVLDESFMDQ